MSTRIIVHRPSSISVEKAVAIINRQMLDYEEEIFLSVVEDNIERAYKTIYDCR
jgi:hypothetical protein